MQSDSALAEENDFLLFSGDHFIQKTKPLCTVVPLLQLSYPKNWFVFINWLRAESEKKTDYLI